MTDTPPPHPPQQQGQEAQEAQQDRQALKAAARARMLRRRRRTVVSALLIVVLGTAGYTVTVATTELPALEATLGVAEEAQYAADATSLEAGVTAQALPTAVGWAHEDEVWANTSEPQSIASITKLVTALVGQAASPLEPGTDGFTHTWTPADRQRQTELIALDGIAFPVPVGSTFTQRQMLELMLLPSANDFAQAYANAIFGSNEGFVAAVSDWKSAHGLDTLIIVEPSGMDAGNQASPADLVRVARLALADPTLTEIARMQRTEIPGIGVVESTNPLLGTDPGVIGLKTGRLFTSGFNLLAAQTADAGGRALVKISVSLGRPTAADRVASSREMLALLEAQPQTVEILVEGEEAGSLVTWTGDTVALLSSDATSAVLVPGETASRTVTLTTLSAPAEGTAPAGTAIGEWIIATPTGEQRVSLITAAPVTEPDLWWRLTHPSIVFGWADPQATGQTPERAAIQSEQ